MFLHHKILIPQTMISFSFFFYFKNDCVRFFLLSDEVCRVSGIISILQIKNLRDRDKYLSKSMPVVPMGLKIAVQLNGLFFRVFCSIWKLRCLENLPWRIFKISKSQGQPDTQRSFTVDPWVKLGQLGFSLFAEGWEPSSQSISHWANFIYHREAAHCQIHLLKSTAPVWPHR